MGSSAECKLLIVSWTSTLHASGYRLQVESNVFNVVIIIIIIIIVIINNNIIIINSSDYYILN